jgi:MFS family permease
MRNVIEVLSPVEAARESRRTSGATAAFACAAMLVSYLPFSAVNGELGTIGKELNANSGELAWVTGSFTIALVVAILIGSVLSKRFGSRFMTLVGLTASIVGCVVGFTGHTLPALWVAQALIGVGAGTVMTASLSLIGATAGSAAARTRSIAVWAGANVAGLGLGPFIAILAASVGGWQWSYAPVVVLAIAVAGLGSIRAKEAPRSSGQGAPLSSILSLLKIPAYSAAALAAFVVLFTVIGVVFTVSVLLSRQGVDALGIALALGCLFAGNAVASVAAGTLQLRVGPRKLLVVGLVVAALGLLAVDFGSPEAGDLSWRLALVGLGAGLVIATSSALAIRTSPPELIAVAGTGNSAIRQLGGAAAPLVLADLTWSTSFAVVLLAVTVATVAIVTNFIITNRKVSS